MNLPASLAHPCYHDDDVARETFEAIRWPDGPYCPHCGVFDTVAPLGGKSMGPGWYWCNKCREKFTARIGSVMERSHIPMHKWLLAFRLLASFITLRDEIISEIEALPEESLPILTEIVPHHEPQQDHSSDTQARYRRPRSS